MTLNSLSKIVMSPLVFFGHIYPGSLENYSCPRSIHGSCRRHGLLTPLAPTTLLTPSGVPLGGPMILRLLPSGGSPGSAKAPLASEASCVALYQSLIITEP